MQQHVLEAAVGVLQRRVAADRCVPCGVANDAAADVDDTPELTDGEGESGPDLEEPENKR